MASLVIAVIALAMSVATGLYKTVLFIEGPNVKLYPPNQVLLSTYYPCTDKNSENCRPYLRIGADMNYANTASYGAIIVNECVSFGLDKNYVQTWQEFVKFEAPAKNQFDLKTTIISQAHPIEVKPNDALSHETYFHPRQLNCIYGSKSSNNGKGDQNYISIREFYNNLYNYSITHRYITFHFESYIPNNRQKILESTCYIEISDINDFVLEIQKQKNQTPMGIAPECKEIAG